MTLVKDDRKKETDTCCTETTNKFRIAVYGSLREGLHNHDYFLGDDKGDLIGTFTTNPEYTMYSVNGSYPALVNKGFTPIVMEVYEVEEDVMDEIDALEGFRSVDDPMNYYNKTSIMTPYGKAWMYLFNEETNDLKIVESGDWKSFKLASNAVNCVGEC